jgi:hypothetical protein
MQSSNKRSQEPVQVRAGTICYAVHDDTVRRGIKDFAILESNQMVQHTTSVQFSGGTSEETAIDSLQLIIEAIERDGLPETTRVIPQGHAAAIKQVHEQFGKLSDNELPPDLRSWFSSLLGEAGELWFYDCLYELSEKLGSLMKEAAERDDEDE